MKPAQFSRILCPVSFSDTSRRTVDVAVTLAAAHNAELRLFHAVSRDAGGEDAEALITSLFSLARHAQRMRISAAVGCGDPASEIRHHARLMRADLIVMGIDLRSARRPSPDTPALAVAAQASCPVLVVRPTPARFVKERWNGFTDILSCIDFLPASLQSADCALALAERNGARVTLLNVLADDEDESPERGDEAAMDIRRRLDAIRSTARLSHGVEAVLTGRPGPEIVGFANRVGSDLIVISAHSGVQSGQKLGATTGYVIMHAQCPVLIVPTAPLAAGAAARQEQAGRVTNV